jgi:hypothetical protein
VEEQGKKTRQTARVVDVLCKCKLTTVLVHQKFESFASFSLRIVYNGGVLRDVEIIIALPPKQPPLLQHLANESVVTISKRCDVVRKKIRKQDEVA